MLRRDFLRGGAVLSAFGPGLIGVRAPLFRSSVGTNCGIPYTQTGSTSFVHNAKTQHLLTVAGRNLQIAFANYVLSAQGELTTAGTNGYYDFTLRAGVRINGQNYQLTQNGNIDIVVPFGTWAKFDPLPIAWSAGTWLTVYNRRVAVIQTATNYNVLASHGTSAGFGEGVLASTNTALDYTFGAIPGGDSASLNFSVSGGVPTATIGANKGSGYTSTPSISVMDPTVYGTTNTAAIVTNAIAATGQPVITVASTTNVAVGMLVGGHPSIPAGATVASFVAATSITLSTNLTGAVANGVTIGLTIPSGGGGAGWAETASQSGGVLTGTVSNTGKGFNYSARTVGSLTGGGGWGTNTQGYGPCAITGETPFRTVSHQMLGNSITRGVGADDGIGDENRCFGIFNRAYAAHRIASGALPYGYIETSYIGNELVSIAGNNYAITYGMVASMCRPTSVHVCNGTNDFAATVTVGVTGGVAGQAVITCTNTTSIVVGLSVNGNAAIPAGSTVVSKVTNTSFTISQNLTATISGTVAASQFGLANVQNSILLIIARERSLGKRVICETTPPRTTSTDGWTTTANQTPVSAAFATGGIVDQYDAWLISMVGTPTGPDYVIDVRATCRDATLTDRWDTSHGPASTDGIHPLQVDRIALALAALNTNGVPSLVAA